MTDAHDPVTERLAAAQNRLTELETLVTRDMPRLLAFARDVLRMCDATDRPTVPARQRHMLETDLIRNAAGRHLKT